MDNFSENSKAGLSAEKERAARKVTKQKVYGMVSKACFIVCACVSVLAILSITAYLFATGIPGMAEVGVFRFLFGTTWAPTNESLPVSERFGILPMIVGSLYVTAGAVVVGVFLGVFSAVFIARFCPKKLKGAVRQVIHLLAGLPSVIFGFFGMAVLVPLLKDFAQMLGIGNRVTGNGVLACSLVLGLMILPTVISLTVNAIESREEGYFLGALALGATKEQAVFKVLVPASQSGILTGAVLGMGRALGETMAVVMVCGNTPGFPQSLFHNMRTLTANIVAEMGYADGLHRKMLLATGLVLFVFVLILSLSVNLLRRKEK